MKKSWLLGWLGLLLSSIDYVTSSSGDRSWFFYNCLKKCVIDQCETVSEADFINSQPIPKRWFSWTCKDECKYSCMWDTIEAFEKDGSPVPQFYGKWPFVRVWGAQEPASVVFSLLNGLAHLYMILKFRKQVPSGTPMYWYWHSYALVCMNTWLWSAVYHTRDTDFTEKMDYFCAFALVAYFWCMFCARVLGPDQKVKVALGYAAVLGVYSSHVYHMAFVHFDYGYNMKVNIAVGLSSCFAWIFWGLSVHHTQPYVKTLIVKLLLLMVCGTLELVDVPPLWWTFDAHSLWHASTVPLVVLFYSFVIDDCKYLAKTQQIPDSSEKPVQNSEELKKLV